MASHGQESKSYFICSHVKRQSLYKLRSTNVGYKSSLALFYFFSPITFHQENMPPKERSLRIHLMFDYVKINK